MDTTQKQIAGLGDSPVTISASPDALDRIRQWLVASLQSSCLPAPERARAGDALGQLGDPRFDPGFYFLPRWYYAEEEPLHGFVQIPEGSFVMGSQEGDTEAAPDESGNPQNMEIPYSYWMARYPVTVAQYGAFIQAKGYDSPDWWTKAGWTWRSGEWYSQGEDEETLDWLKRRPARLREQPMWWDEQHIYSNRPAVGVSWFEAMAYCRWLDARLKAADGFQVPAGYAVRLPTEAEWEKAARSAESRRYPWGDEPCDEERANINDSQINRATSVGMYPRGATPSGIHDLSGNMWEWTYSLNRPYPYNPRDGRNDPDVLSHRRMRGGSWLFDAICSRCTARGGGPPDHYNNVVGFRVVISLENPGL